MNLVCELSYLAEIEKYNQLGISDIVVPVKYFTPRANEYFDECTLEEIRLKTKQCNMRMFIDITRMFVDEEMSKLEDFLRYVKGLEVDGIYFSDLSVFESCREQGMEALCIYQSDTLIVNSYDADFFLKQGMQAICIARELTLDEIKEIIKDNPNKCEVFIHGRLLMSVSKRPLINNYFQQIKYPNKAEGYYYLKEELRDGLFPVFENEQGTHFFSENILNSFNELAELRLAKSLRCSRILIDDQEYFDALKLYIAMMNNKAIDYEAFIKAYPNSLYDSGFYFKKTSVKKEY